MKIIAYIIIGLGFALILQSLVALLNMYLGSL